MKHYMHFLLFSILMWICLPFSEAFSEQADSLPWETASFFLSVGSSSVRDEVQMNHLVEKIVQSTNGRYYCNFYSDGMLGNDENLLEAVRTGALSVVFIAPSAQTNLIPELALMDIPYLFKDVESCNVLLEGPLLDFFQPYYNERGLQLIAWSCLGFRQLTSDFEIQAPEDISQLKIRILNNRYHNLYWSSIGASPVVISYENLFYALQQKLVNSQENIPNSTVSLNLQEFQPYVYMINYLPSISCVVMNKDYYDCMDSSDRSAIIDIFREHCMTRSKAAIGESNASLDLFSSVIKPGADVTERLRSGADAVKDAIRAGLGDNLLELFLSIIEK